MATTRARGERSASARVAGFVGRETELATLVATLEQARSGRGSLVLIGGEPGIGKSRLADEFATRAHDSGARVAWGKSWEGAGAPPYWPWIQALRVFLRDADPASARELLGAGAADVAQMLPEIRSRLPELPPPSADSDSARFQLFDSTASFVRRIAESGEILIILDDLHAADTPSILFLRFLSTQLQTMRIVIVATYRDVEVTPEHPLSSALLELARQPTTQLIALIGLREEVVAEFIESTANIAGADRLAREMWRETNGNPLFLGEALRLLVSEKRFADAAAGGQLRLSVPAGVREVITRRLNQLSPETVRALTVGSVLGPEFSLDLLRRVTGEPTDKLLALIGEATRSGLVSDVATSTSDFRFSHDLVRESLYDEQSPADRVNLHRRIAEALEAAYANSVEAHLAELAYHYFEAAQGTDEPDLRAIAMKAHDYAERAGLIAGTALAYEEAARLFRIGLAALDLAHEDRSELRAQLLLEIGEAESRAGDLEDAQRAFLEAADISRRSGNARRLAVAALGYGGRIGWARPGADTRLVPLLQEAVVFLGSTDELLRARLLTRLACALRSSPDQRQQSDNLSGEALEIARRVGDPQTLGYALIGRYYATLWPENPEQRSTLARETVAVAEETADAELMVDGHLLIWLSQTETGQRTEGRSSLDQVTRLAREMRQPAQLWLGIGPRALVELMEGNFDVAAELIEQERETWYPYSLARDNVSAARFHEFLLSRDRRTLDEAEPAVRAAVEEFPWYPLHRAALALLLIELGRVDDGRAVFDGLATDSFRALYRDNEWLLGMSLASECCYLLDDQQAAPILYEQLAPFAGRHAIGHAEGSVGALDRYLGLLSLTTGNTNRAIAHLRAAVDLNEHMRARPWTARSQRDLALALEKRGTAADIEQAAALRAAARETATAIGLTALIADPADETTDTRSAADADGQPATDVMDGVFRLEGEYWTIEFGPDRFRLRDGKGLRHLARLLAAPGQEIVALDLARESSASAPGAERFEPGLTSDALGDAGAALDPSAKQAYRERVNELRAELDEAESWNDPERANRAREELSFITRELAAAVGIGGRDRATASPGERARVSVTRAIRLAMERVTGHSAALGAHLEATIHTGTYCAYRPDPRVPITWHR